MSKRKVRYGTPVAGAAGAITPGSIGAFDLDTGMPLADGMDLNDLTDPGTWFSENGTVSAAVSHSPQSSYGYKLFVMAVNSDRVTQLAITSVGACTVYLRHYANSSWGTWRTIATAQ